MTTGESPQHAYHVMYNRMKQRAYAACEVAMHLMHLGGSHSHASMSTTMAAHSLQTGCIR